MCRWFAYISPSEPCLLEDVLVNAAHSLSKQVHEHYLPELFSRPSNGQDEKASREDILGKNTSFNIDGLGVVWYTSTRHEFVDLSIDSLYPIQYKTLLHPMSDANFLSLCANTSSLTCFGHIRAATSVSGVPTLSETNCHPFCKGKFSIMHNGTIAHFKAIRREIMALLGEEEAAWIQGNTDSETLAALFYTYLGEETGKGGKAVHEHVHDVEVLKKVLTRTIVDVIRIQKRVMEQKNEPVEPSTINLAISDGKVLLCCRFRNHPTDHPPSLYYSTTAGKTLNRKFPGHPDGEDEIFVDHFTGKTHGEQCERDHGTHVIVASEPTTYKLEEWTLVEKNSFLIVDSEGNVTMESIVGN
ncbi:hypothetical protein Clacol_009083 [Clathrus columnatus]|uniref:Glutamine amidotransferase type-2 domain-containing protein n=1 Tax=Clathrus columnatus TaxID=1419009 RepID=A0AAV5ASE8_9AGAM|nr:hypothetical protein Clacol_009083 [Clathrus columnatus]